MKSVLTLVVIGTLASAVSARQTESAKPPAPPADLAAMSRIPLLTVRVTDHEGNPPGVPVYVNWRNLTDGLNGGGQTVQSGQCAGQFNLTNRLSWSASRGWHFTQVGPHRIEIVADGFKTSVIDSVVLQAGRTERMTVVLERRGPTEFLAPEVYLRLAAEQLLKTVRAEKADIGRIQAVGPPTILPEHARGLSTARRIPEAFVVATIFVNGKFREPAVVTFTDGLPAGRFSYPFYPPDGTDFLAIDETEWQTMSTALGDFYAVAADVSRGPERFLNYLPADMRRMLDLRGEKNRMFLTPDAVRYRTISYGASWRSPSTPWLCPPG
jgi:hypothetical protein